MPREIKSVPITFASQGIVLKSSADEIPITSYKALVNVQTDRENTLSVRKGFTRLNIGLPSAPYSLYHLRDADGYLWRYAVAGRVIFVAPVEHIDDDTIWPLAWNDAFGAVLGGAGFGGGVSREQDPRAFWASYNLVGMEMKPYVFYADGQEFLKHSGGLANMTRVGIPKPMPLTEVALAENSFDLIEDFGAYAWWTAENAIFSEVNPGYKATTIATQIKVTGDGAVGGGYKAITSGLYPTVVDLSTMGPDSVIELHIKFLNPESAINCKEITLSFNLHEDVGDTSFATTYQRVISPSVFEAASQPGSLGRTSAFGDAIESAQRRLSFRNVENLSYDPTDVLTRSRDIPPEEYSNQESEFDTGQSTATPPGWGVWNTIRIMKSDFKRVGQTELSAPELDWSKVVAIRIDIKLNDTAVGGKTCSVQFDDCVHLLTGNLFGTDYTWSYTYYNSLTGTESDFADVVPAPSPGAEFAQYTLHFPVCPPTNPPNADPDKIRIYRLGGTLSSFRLVDTIDYTPSAAPPDYTDNIADGDLHIDLEEDNQLPVDKPVGVVVWDDRLWTWGGQTTDSDWVIHPEPLNQLRFSKANQVEMFPVNNRVLVGPGTEKIMTCLESDGELFIFTTTKVYRMLGSGGAYRAIGTAFNQGVVSSYGVCRGTRSMYMYCYDGLYEFPSGRKISEPIDQIFKQERVNEIPPLAAGREAEVALEFYDSKLYMSYCTTIDTSIRNDATLVFDTLYERWRWYMYGAQTMRFEPDSRILVGGNLTQWDQILDGVPSGFHRSGPYPMRLENGFVDKCEDGDRGIFWAVDTRDYDLDAPDQEKRIFDFVVDADTQGTAILLQVAFDMQFGDAQQAQPPYDSIGYINTIGRQRVILPVPMESGDSVLAIRIALRITSTTAADSTSATRLYKIIHRFLEEPIRHRTFITDWDNYGSPGPGFFRELWVELDTFGHALQSIELQVDQAVAQVLSPFPGVTGQQRVYLGLQPDIRGTLARLKFIPTGENQLKVYDHSLVKVPEPTYVNTVQTPWTDEGWPYHKLWKEVLLDVDTNGMTIGFNLWVDNKIRETWEVLTHGRERLTHSVEKDTIGKLARVTVDVTSYDENCCLPQGVRFYGVSYVIDKEPADVTFSDTYDYLWSFDRLKVLRRLWIALKNPDCDVSMAIYVDETLVTTKTIMADLRSTGFSKRRVDVEGAVKGRLFRIQFTGVFAFRLYWDRSEWELKDLNTEDGYRREKMTPPQTF